MRRPVQLRELHWRENRARALLWVRGLLFFLSTGIWVVPGAEFCRILHKTLSKSEAYSAASLPAGPEVHCFTR